MPTFNSSKCRSQRPDRNAVYKRNSFKNLTVPIYVCCIKSFFCTLTLYVYCTVRPKSRAGQAGRRQTLLCCVIHRDVVPPDAEALQGPRHGRSDDTIRNATGLIPPFFFFFLDPRRVLHPASAGAGMQNTSAITICGTVFLQNRERFKICL